MSQKTVSVKETPIIDDVDDEVCEEQKPPWSDTSVFTDQSLTTGNLDKIVDYGDKLSVNLMKEGAAVAAAKVTSDIANSVLIDEIQQFSSASEYSAHLLSKILDDKGLNGLKKDMEKELFFDIASTRQLSMNKDERSLKRVDSGVDENSDDPPSLELELSVEASSASNSSAESDTSSDVSDDSSAHSRAVMATSISKEPQNKGKGMGLPDVIPASRPFKQNGGLESIKEVTDSCEKNKKAAQEVCVDVTSNTPDSVKQELEATEVNNRDTRSRTCSSLQGTPSSVANINNGEKETSTNEIYGWRKESIVSNDSNADEDEGRDVVEALVKRREEKLASYGSSLRLNIAAKKVRLSLASQTTLEGKLQLFNNSSPRTLTQVKLPHK